MTERLRRALFDERDAAGLAFFRVLLGVLGCVSALRFLHYGWVDEFFVRPTFFFHHWFAPFARPLGATGMHAVFWIMALSGALVALGLAYRLAIVTFFVTITYVQLADVTNYLNHYYLVSLLALLMCVMPLGRAYSLDALLFPATRRATLPGWCSVLLKVQVGTVYTYAGVAKITSDWLLHAQPLDIWLSSRTGLPVIGPALALPFMPYVMAWAGCLFDLTIAGWLTWRRSRPYAFAVVLFFHFMTSQLFPIGMFPVIMVVGATTFFDASWPRRFLPRRLAAAPAQGPRVVPHRALVSLGAAYCALQLLLPLRAFLYGGDVLWHEQGMRFSWRVMVREKNASVTYLVENPRTGRVIEVPPRLYLDGRQQRELGTQPDLVLQLAHKIAADYAQKEGGPVRVRADVLVSLNGRRAARLIDPDVDLATVEDGLAPKAWILPAPTTRPPYLHAPSWNSSTSASRR